MITFLKNSITKLGAYISTHDIRQDSFMVSTFVVLLLIVIGQSIFLSAYFFSMPDVIVIHSNIYFGIDLIGERIYSAMLPLAAIIISILHGFAIVKLFKIDRELSRVLMGGTLVIASLLFVNVTFIIRLNV